MSHLWDNERCPAGIGSTFHRLYDDAADASSIKLNVVCHFQLTDAILIATYDNRLLRDAASWFMRPLPHSYRSAAMGCAGSDIAAEKLGCREPLIAFISPIVPNRKLHRACP
jgi:hypothetical protein